MFALMVNLQIFRLELTVVAVKVSHSGYDSRQFYCHLWSESMPTIVLLHPKMKILSSLHAVISSVKQNEETLLSSYWPQVVKLQKKAL